MRKVKFIIYISFIFFLFSGSKLNSNIKNSIIMTIGNEPVTYLDLIKEMKIISIISRQSLDETNKESIKALAVKALIKRKIKEMEIIKYDIKDFNQSDLKNLIIKTSNNLGTDLYGLEQIMEKNQMTIKNLKERYEVDLKWNTLIFELYKNKISLNMNEVEEKINTEIKRLDTTKRKFLLSEIEIRKNQGNDDEKINKIIENIKKEGFEKTAKKFSTSISAEYGGNIGWIDEKNLSQKIRNNIQNLKVEEISDPIFLENTIVLIRINGVRKFEKNIEKIKNRIVRLEKEKKLQMFSNSHYINLERVVPVNFL